MMLLRNRPTPDGWQTWFAWYPVATSDGLVWLETVKWRWVGGYDPYVDYERLDYSRLGVPPTPPPAPRKK